MSIDDEQKTAGKQYKSPKWKLIRFFEGSIDNWKKKTQDAKYQIKLLRKRIKGLKKNKEKFKERTKNLEHQLQQMKENEKVMRDEIERLKKNL